MGKPVFTLPITVCSLATRVVTGTGALLLATQAMAAAVITLEGTTPDALRQSQAGLKLSVLEWTGQEQRQKVIEGFRVWKEGGEAEAFADLLNNQETQGYLFTGEVTGYSLKYTTENSDGSVTMLITPGLKTKNRYLWKTPAPEQAPPFTLLEIRGDEGEAELFTSLDGEIVLDDGSLRLDEGDHDVFGTLRDATPYYLKQSN